MKTTSEFSFILKPSNYGVGVFSVHDIKKGTDLRLFEDNETPVTRFKKRCAGFVSRVLYRPEKTSSFAQKTLSACTLGGM